MEWWHYFILEFEKTNIPLQMHFNFMSDHKNWHAILFSKNKKSLIFKADAQKTILLKTCIKKKSHLCKKKFERVLENKKIIVRKIFFKTINSEEKYSCASMLSSHFDFFHEYRNESKVKFLKFLMEDKGSSGH